MNSTLHHCAHSRHEPLEDRLHRILEHGPRAIDERLAELDAEWSSGRVTKVTLAVISGVGLVLAFLVSPWFAVLPALASVCLVQYIFNQPCAVSKMARWVGFRGGREIEEERLALKALRGDFKHLPTVHQVDDDSISRMVDEGGPAYEDDDHVSPHEAVREVVGAARN
jgi:hypothetical protein